MNFDILNNRDFRFLLILRFLVIFSLQAQAVVVGWQIYAITGDPLLLGLAGLAEAVPALIGSLFSGHVVDTRPPHKVYRICLTGLVMATLGMMIVAGGYVPVPKGWIVPCLFAGVFLSGLMRCFVIPAAFALLSAYIPRARMATAGAWINIAFQSAAIGGPAVAGLVYGGYGPHGAWLLPASFLLGGMVVALNLKPVPRQQGTRRESARKSIRAGWAFILGNPVILSAMALDMFAVLFGGAVAMLPAYADQILHVGPEGLGILRAAPAIGSGLTAIYLAMRPMRYLSGRALLLAFTGFALCMIVFGLSKTMWLSVLCLAASGMFDCINVVTRSSTVQLLTPTEMKGRVSAVGSMFIISSNEIGAFESGLAAHVLGLVPSVVFGGVMSLAAIAAIAFFSPSLRKLVIDTHHDPDEPKPA